MYNSSSQAADGSGNTSTMASTDGKTGCINTTGDAAHAHEAHKLPKVSRLAILFFFFHLEAPFCAAVGQRTRGRRPKTVRETLQNIDVRLV